MLSGVRNYIRGKVRVYSLIDFKKGLFADAEIKKTEQGDEYLEKYINGCDKIQAWYMPEENDVDYQFVPSGSESESFETESKLRARLEGYSKSACSETEPNSEVKLDSIKSELIDLVKSVVPNESDINSIETNIRKSDRKVLHRMIDDELKNVTSTSALTTYIKGLNSIKKKLSTYSESFISDVKSQMNAPINSIDDLITQLSQYDCSGESWKELINKHKDWIKSLLPIQLVVPVDLYAESATELLNKLGKLISSDKAVDVEYGGEIHIDRNEGGISLYRLSPTGNPTSDDYYLIPISKLNTYSKVDVDVYPLLRDLVKQEVLAKYGVDETINLSDSDYYTKFLKNVLSKEGYKLDSEWGNLVLSPVSSERVLESKIGSILSKIDLARPDYIAVPKESFDKQWFDFVELMWFLKDVILVKTHSQGEDQGFHFIVMKDKFEV